MSRFVRKHGISLILDAAQTRGSYELERVVVSLGLLMLVVTLRQVERKLRRGESIQFEEIYGAAMGRLRTFYILEAWTHWGQSRQMSLPVEISWLKPQIQEMIPRLPLYSTVKLHLDRIATLISGAKRVNNAASVVSDGTTVEATDKSDAGAHDLQDGNSTQTGCEPRRRGRKRKFITAYSERFDNICKKVRTLRGFESTTNDQVAEALGPNRSDVYELLAGKNMEKNKNAMRRLEAAETEAGFKHLLERLRSRNRARSNNSNK
jgi:hypothetical protein